MDAFCGSKGDMHAAVWSRAASYVGVDLEWLPADARRRFTAEASLVLRSVDLTAFNVFDLDAFGSPWTEAIIIAARRSWAPGERGALIVTDGSAGKEKWGQGVAALSQLVGHAHHKSLIEERQRSALVEWCKRSGVVPEHVWTARGASNTKGSQVMFYAAVVFHGITRPREASAGPS